MNRLFGRFDGDGDLDRVMLPEARSFNDIAATFKNFDLSVQSRTPVPSLLFESHRGDYRR